MGTMYTIALMKKQGRPSCIVGRMADAIFMMHSAPVEAEHGLTLIGKLYDIERKAKIK